MSAFDDDQPATAVRSVTRKTAIEKRLEILDKVRSTDPSILEAVDQGRLSGYLPTVETRNAFSMLRTSEQIFAAFFECPGVDQRKLSELCRHTAKMERAGTLRDVKVDRTKVVVTESGIPPGMEVGPEMALACLTARELIRSKK